jgi:hypothetical protein
VISFQKSQTPEAKLQMKRPGQKTELFGFEASFSFFGVWTFGV